MKDEGVTAGRQSHDPASGSLEKFALGEKTEGNR